MFFWRNTNLYRLNPDFEHEFRHTINGTEYTFKNTWAALYAHRAPSKAGQFSLCDHNEAKELNAKTKKSEIDPDYDKNRFEIAKSIVRDKVYQTDFIREFLKNITDETIYYENSFQEQYWGIYKGRGFNAWGKILTSIRDELRKEAGLFPVKKDDPEDKRLVYKVQHHGYVTFDTETTGVSAAYDDILQITIIGQYGEILLSTYVKPRNCYRWDEAQAVNHISPEIIKKYGKDPDIVAKAAIEIFESADCVWAQNAAFDIKMVKACFGYDIRSKEKDRVFKNFTDDCLYKEKIDKVGKIIEYIVREINNGTPNKKLITGLNNSYLEEGTFYYNRLKKTFNGTDEDGKKTHNNRNDLKSINISDPDTVQTLANSIIDLRLGDTLDYARAFIETDDEKYNLGSIIRSIMPEKYSEFMSGAHNAEIDTKYTAKVVDWIYMNYPAIAPKCISQPVKASIKNMFGLKKGMICNIVPTNENKISNFSDRIFKCYPEVYEKYHYFIMNYDDKDLFGKANITPIEENPEISIINMFAQKDEYTDLDAFTDIIKKTILKFPDKPVYLPVISMIKDSHVMITDGIGAGSDHDWKKVKDKLINNIPEYLNSTVLLDTQTGELFKYNETTREYRNEEGIAISFPEKEMEYDDMSSLEII